MKSSIWILTKNDNENNYENNNDDDDNAKDICLFNLVLSNDIKRE